MTTTLASPISITQTNQITYTCASNTSGGKPNQATKNIYMINAPQGGVYFIIPAENNPSDIVINISFTISRSNSNICISGSALANPATTEVETPNLVLLSIGLTTLINTDYTPAPNYFVLNSSDKSLLLEISLVKELSVGAIYFNVNNLLNEYCACVIETLAYPRIIN
jgi:hypothetical protein